MDGAFVAKLQDAFVEGFSFGDVFGVKAGKNFRLELGEGFIVEASGDGNGVANSEEGGVDDADDVSGIGVLDGTPFSCDHAVGTGEADLAVGAVVFDDKVFFKAAGANADEGHAVAVSAVHVGLKFEDVAAERGCYGIYFYVGAVGEGGEAGVGAGR